MIETHLNILERRRSMHARGLKETFFRKPLYVYIEKLTAKQATIPKQIIVTILSDYPICIIHARGEELLG